MLVEATRDRRDVEGLRYSVATSQSGRLEAERREETRLQLGVVGRVVALRNIQVHAIYAHSDPRARDPLELEDHLPAERELHKRLLVDSSVRGHQLTGFCCELPVARVLEPDGVSRSGVECNGLVAAADELGLAWTFHQTLREVAGYERRRLRGRCRRIDVVVVVAEQLGIKHVSDLQRDAAGRIGEVEDRVEPDFLIRVRPVPLGEPHLPQPVDVAWCNQKIGSNAAVYGLRIRPPIAPCTTLCGRLSSWPVCASPELLRSVDPARPKLIAPGPSPVNAVVLNAWLGSRVSAVNSVLTRPSTRAGWRQAPQGR